MNKTTFTYDEVLLPELVMASHALTEDQKNVIIKKLSDIAETKKRKLFEILVNEQVERYKINKNRIMKNNAYIYKKTKAVNTYNERLEQLNENNVLKTLDEEFDKVFSEN